MSVCKTSEAPCLFGPLKIPLEEVDGARAAEKGPLGCLGVPHPKGPQHSPGRTVATWRPEEGALSRVAASGSDGSTSALLPLLLGALSAKPSPLPLSHLLDVCLAGPSLSVSRPPSKLGASLKGRSSIQFLLFSPPGTVWAHRRYQLCLWRELCLLSFSFNISFLPPSVLSLL